MATMLPSDRGEGSDKFANQTSSGPETSALIKEGRDLSSDSTVPVIRGQLTSLLPGVLAMLCPYSTYATEVSRRYHCRDLYVPGRRAQNPSVNILQVIGCEDGVLGLERRAGVHLGEDFLGEGLFAVDASATSVLALCVYRGHGSSVRAPRLATN